MSDYFYLKAITLPSVIKLVNNRGNAPDIKYSEDLIKWKPHFVNVFSI